MKRTITQALSVAIVMWLIGLFSSAVGEPFLVPSLASAVFVQVLMPDRTIANAWNVGVGQFVGAICSFACVHIVGTAAAPMFADHQPLVVSRVVAVTLAVATTLGLQVAVKATGAAGEAPRAARLRCSSRLAWKRRTWRGSRGPVAASCW